MIHAKSESDMTSLDPSSPRSPKRPVYYVQSPSRDSHEESSDKGLTQTTATPTFNSPTDSPSHPSYGPHSRASSASRVSGGYRWAASYSGRKGRKRGGGGWPERHMIVEEGGYEALYGYDRGISTARCRVVLGVLGFVVLFSVFCSVLWGASRPFPPRISIRSINVHNFYYGEGSDRTGVPTKMLTLNSSVRIAIHNPATFFGIHVSFSPLKLMFSDLTVATGQPKEYYQPRKSKHTETVEVVGREVPLYGAGARLAASDQSGGVRMRLALEVRSRGNVVGILVKAKHQRRLTCSFIVGSSNTKPCQFVAKPF